MVDKKDGKGAYLPLTSDALAKHNAQSELKTAASQQAVDIGAYQAQLDTLQANISDLNTLEHELDLQKQQVLATIHSLAVKLAGQSTSPFSKPLIKGLLSDMDKFTTAVDLKENINALLSEVRKKTKVDNFAIDLHQQLTALEFLEQRREEIKDTVREFKETQKAIPRIIKKINNSTKHPTHSRLQKLNSSLERNVASIDKSSSTVESLRSDNSSLPSTPSSVPSLPELEQHSRGSSRSEPNHSTIKQQAQAALDHSVEKDTTQKCMDAKQKMNDILHPHPPSQRPTGPKRPVN